LGVVASERTVQSENEVDLKSSPSVSCVGCIAGSPRVLDAIHDVHQLLGFFRRSLRPADVIAKAEDVYEPNITIGIDAADVRT